jgi:hypothetical protein
MKKKKGWFVCSGKKGGIHGDRKKILILISRLGSTGEVADLSFHINIFYCGIVRDGACLGETSFALFSPASWPLWLSDFYKSSICACLCVCVCVLFLFAYLCVFFGNFLERRLVICVSNAISPLKGFCMVFVFIRCKHSAGILGAIRELFMSFCVFS